MNEPVLGWKKNAPTLPVFGHKFQPIEASKRRCKVCRLPLNSEVFGKMDGQPYGCVNLGCRISRVHVSCMQSVTSCKKVSLTGSGSYRSKTARTSSNPTAEITFHRANESKLKKEETEGGFGIIPSVAFKKKN